MQILGISIRFLDWHWFTCKNILNCREKFVWRFTSAMWYGILISPSGSVTREISSSARPCDEIASLVPWRTWSSVARSSCAVCLIWSIRPFISVNIWCVITDNNPTINSLVQLLWSSNNEPYFYSSFYNYECSIKNCKKNGYKIRINHFRIWFKWSMNMFRKKTSTIDCRKEPLPTFEFSQFPLGQNPTSAFIFQLCLELLYFHEETNRVGSNPWTSIFLLKSGRFALLKSKVMSCFGLFKKKKNATIFLLHWKNILQSKTKM